jgi:hypothetical protein
MTYCMVRIPTYIKCSEISTKSWFDYGANFGMEKTKSQRHNKTSFLASV